MKQIVCPSCGHTGKINEKLIPPEGRNVKCPACKESFFIDPQGMTPGSPASTPPPSPTSSIGPGESQTAAPEIGSVPSGGEIAVEGLGLPGVIIAGTIAAVIGAAIWALITRLTGFQIGFMAIGIGVLVGITVRVTSDQGGMEMGLLGGALSLFGVALGNLLAACAFIAKNNDLSFMHVLTDVLTNPDTIGRVMRGWFSLIDLLFYGLAIYTGFQVASSTEPLE